MLPRFTIGSEASALRPQRRLFADRPPSPAARAPTEPRRREPPPERPEFSDLAPRVHRFEQRLRSPHDAVRLRLLVELTHFRPRDARAFPPYFTHLLQDPAPVIRWEAARRLAYQLGPAHELPRLSAWQVPMHGLVDGASESSVARLRARTIQGGGSRLAWGLEALGLLGDEPSGPLFETYLNAPAPKLRLRAALAAVRAGRKDRGMNALHDLAHGAPEQEAPLVPVLAAEALVRAGERDALGLLVRHARSYDWTSLAHGPEQLLEDLTGQFRDSPEQWAEAIGLEQA